MPHLAVFRRGWENEHLAAFILSKFAFVAHPAKIGDDVGTDFFCTFFETVNQTGKDYLVPTNSFAIQVKSSGNLINSTNQIQYLSRLELPFFVGIIDQKDFKLTIYSGEYLPVLFSHKGVPISLTLELRPQHDFPPESYYEKTVDKAYRLKCPLVATISAVMASDALTTQANSLKAVAGRIFRNIAAWKSEEYIFAVGADGHLTTVMSGPGSVKHRFSRHE